ncbi:hypothetical protein D3871_17335 [Noviherbaspirillum saxi]|uniref:Uncharacterized protein n=1 Tax=Noviherbaspirillum saxi TaxID=2320863 RepID=A0A3A3FIY2_9BURK|nr:hypothetical protein D3871_17335 [Noviherbaspirillum saxi]
MNISKLLSYSHSASSMPQAAMADVLSLRGMTVRQLHKELVSSLPLQEAADSTDQKNLSYGKLIRTYLTPIVCDDHYDRDFSVYLCVAIFSTHMEVCDVSIGENVIKTAKEHRMESRTVVPACKGKQYEVRLSFRTDWLPGRLPLKHAPVFREWRAVGAF